MAEASSAAPLAPCDTARLGITRPPPCARPRARL